MARYKRFSIDTDYCSTVREVKYRVNMENPTPEDLIKILKNEHIRSICYVDHPKFTELRNNLEKLGYISTCREISNGDYVLKPFYLNDVFFAKQAQFPCAPAIHYDLIRKKSS
jgi:hypothetical protein